MIKKIIIFQRKVKQIIKAQVKVKPKVKIIRY